jgi:Ca-activated chloride channel family protein
MAQTLTAPSGLLSSEGARVPLVGVLAEAQIRDYACRVVLSQRFRSDEDRPIEAVYKFPIDEAAAVCGFEVEIDGRRILGRVEEREKAFETYDEALTAGHGAYLLDEERADVFTASVGNLPPGKEAILRITTVSELPLEGDAIRFTLPTTIAPRYAPAEDQKGVGETEAERVSPPYALEVPYGLSLKVDVETSVPVRSVESPSHPVAVTIEDGHARVTLSEREAALDRDVVLRISLAETHRPHALVERGPDGEAYALVSFRPTLGSKPAAAEVLFVVDRSGSMQGTSIAEARNALQLALRSLRPGCVFNIVGFGSRFDALFPESRPYDDESLAEATAHVRALEADLGGTEILPALEHVFGTEPRKGLPRQLFVLTDGEVSNTDAVIALARRHAGDTRVFTLGIGAGASHHLVKGLARAGEGEAEFIAPGERIEGKVLRQLSRALSPALTDVSVDWAGLGVEQAPFEVPPVFAEGRVLLFARVEKAEPATVTLRASSPDGDVSLPLALDPTSAAEGTLVATLWARHMIRDLEEGRSVLHPRRGSQQKRALDLKDEQVKAAIVRLGTTWGLVSRHTSFVAVEERETPTSGEAQLRKVPVAITRGWHGMPMVLGASGVVMPQAAGARYRTVDGASGAMGAARTQMPDLNFLGRDARALRSAPEAASQPVPPLVSRLRTLMGARGTPATPPAAGPGRQGPTTRPLDRLVALQRADGSWTLDDDLAQALGWPGAKSLRKAAACDLRGHRQERAFATALALAWLDRECADARDEWRLLADKAREQLDRTPEGASAWLDRAAAVLASRTQRG